MLVDVVVVGGVNSRCVGAGTKRRRQWMICEGFQMILKMQADALVTLGVGSRFRVSSRIQVWRHSLRLVPA